MFKVSLRALAACLFVLGCTPTPSGNGGGGDDTGPANDRGPDDSGPIEDMQVPDLGRVDVGDDCMPTDELCNGMDDDCDGVVDNGFAGLGAACTVGEGLCAAQGINVCNADGSALACDATAGEPGVETCDGRDEDCDGAADEDFAVGQPCSVGVGACAADGVTACDPAGEGTVCGAEPGAPGDELCDGIDDDCDGTADEGTDGGACETGEAGQCAAGLEACVDGAVICQPATGPAEEICDGIDNDCDGMVDDVDGLGAACSAGVGACAADGVTACGPDGLACDAIPGMPSAEVCDGIDNDCDGMVDDVDGVGRACAVGVGACSAAGTTICTPDGVTCDAEPGLPVAELCDGIDNDCNGRIDDVPGLGGPCQGGVGACGVPGITICTPAGLACDADPGQPVEETCNGVDDDCNGAVDDVFGVGGPCTVGIGPCTAAGVTVCAPGGLVCDAEPLPGRPEVCDGVDNDCNGTVDDPPVCGVFDEDCDNGIDDDGNGRADCTDPACLADPACAPPRDVLLLCGASNRDMSVLIEPQDGLAFAAGCAPDAQTQAMLVSRDGINQIDDPGWTAYLEGGGRIITEYSASDEVFNAVFDAAVPAGPQSGGCLDNVNPAFRLSLDDPFWQANGALPITPPDETGCGLDLSGFPDIVALGGHTDGAVHLGYRDLGLGRLYLVEGDWQDVDSPDPRYFSDATRALLRYMVLSGPAQVGSFRVGDGPVWNGGEALALSCVEACARIFGGVAGAYGCSTIDGEYNGMAYVSGYADGQYCAGEGVAEDFVVPANGAPYNCGAFGCAYSAYVSDNCGDSTNYCWRNGGAAGPRPEICDDGLDNDLDGPVDCDDADCVDDPACAVIEPAGGLIPGVQQGVPAAAIAARGWRQCFRGTYGTNGESIDALLAACDGSQMMIGCRPVGAADLTLAAEGLTAEVTRNVGNGREATNPHNGVEFYFDPTYSWGFAPGGAAVARSSCDTAADQPELRMCWHAGGANVLESGYRCGNTFLNGDDTWERLVYTRDIVALGRAAGFGHHGNCETFNDCGDAATCAGLACQNAGLGPAVSWLEGNCSTLSQGAVPDIVCNLFSNLDAQNLDAGWGPSGGCDIPVAYDVTCAPAP